MNPENIVSGAEEPSIRSEKLVGKRLPNDATARELEMAHKVKMKAKQMVRAHHHRAMTQDKPYIPANLSRNHPDYGMSMREHLDEKVRRVSEKSS